MPIHDWTRVQPGLFHHFHQDWSIEVARELNRGRLPKGFYALVEQRVDGPEPDVIAVETKMKVSAKRGGATATLEPPRTRLVKRASTEAGRYARKANRISIHHALGHVVSLIELVSPGNKDTRHALQSFVEKAEAFIRAGVHLLIVDLFPSSSRDPHGIHKAIFDQFQEQRYTRPKKKPLTLVSYQAAAELIAHIEPVAVGDLMPDMPLFLTPEAHILVPLESTYQTTWEICPEPIRDLVEAGSR